MHEIELVSCRAPWTVSRGKADAWGEKRLSKLKMDSEREVGSGDTKTGCISFIIFPEPKSNTASTFLLICNLALKRFFLVTSLNISFAVYIDETEDFLNRNMYFTHLMKYNCKFYHSPFISVIFRNCYSVFLFFALNS